MVINWGELLAEFGNAFGLLVGLTGVILNGLRSEIVETKSGPNQGIELSGKNAIFGGLISALSFGLVIELIEGLSGFGRVMGLTSGILGLLWYGGFDISQHYTLRLILLIQGHAPANY